MAIELRMNFGRETMVGAVLLIEEVIVAIVKSTWSESERSSTRVLVREEETSFVVRIQ